MEKSRLEKNMKYLDDYAKIANTLESRRKEMGYSLKDLEKKTGLCVPAISRMTSVSNKPRLDTLYKVLDALDLELKIVRKENKENPGGLRGNVNHAKHYNNYNVWVKKEDQIDLLKVKAKTKYEARQIVQETNEDWVVCGVDRA